MNSASRYPSVGHQAIRHFLGRLGGGIPLIGGDLGQPSRHKRTALHGSQGAGGCVSESRLKPTCIF